MKKVMKTFIFGSKGFMRMLLLCMMTCFSLLQARANYWYKVTLRELVYETVDGKTTVKDGKKELTTDWIFSEDDKSLTDGLGWKNSLTRLVGYVEIIKDNDGNETSRKRHPGIGITDVTGKSVSLEYEKQGQVIENYKKDVDDKLQTKPKYKIVKIWFKGRSDGGDNYNILASNDWYSLQIVENDIEEMDLSDWGKTEYKGSYYFANMSNLKTLYLPNNDFAIGNEYMFAGCVNLENIVFGTGTKITAIGKGAFKHGNKIPQTTIQRMIDEAATYAKTHPNANGIEYNKIGDEAFYQCYQITELEIPDGIAEIGSDAFSMTKAECSFNKLTFAGSNIKIGDKAFQGCEMLKDIVLGNNVKITNLGEAVFADSRCISNESVASILNNYAANSAETENITDRGVVKYIPAYLFFGVQGKGDHNTCQLNFDKLNIPDAFGAIGEGAFGHTEDYIQQFKEIIVNAAVAPVCGKPEGVYRGKNTDDDVFSNVGANHVTITFNGAAAGYSTDGSTGYKTYRNESEFMRLLTKTLDEDKETYDVYPQMYADVKLKRSFKQGWNTLALPFGSPANGNKEVDCAEVYTKALGCSDIAVYRGLRENSQDASKSVFTFLHYGNVQVDPLDEFEPILVKMPAT
ncbi:MAG: leucine-rich repeat domain-containing protein, partial [Clostridium sp.]|nr:leucine-rich repeat domain-containing protein [Clostridium sp.]